jgi:uncharacterized protein YkwD
LPEVKATSEILELEHAMFERVNQDRKKEGLPPLQYDERLADVARVHSHDMKTTGFFSHDSPNTGSLEDRLDAAGYLAEVARENLASAPTVDQAEENLLASAGHRANIMSAETTHIGIGIVRGDRKGDPRMLTVTQVFAIPMKLQQAAEVLQAVRQALDTARRAKGLRPLAPHDELDELAQEHVEDLPIDLNEDVLDRIGDDIAAELSSRSGHGLKGVELSAQVVFNASQFEPSAAAMQPAAKFLGSAAVRDTDGRGRTQTKVILLIGR